MQEAKNKCPNCGQFKMRQRRIIPMSIGAFLLLVSAILVPWGVFFTIPQLTFLWGGIAFIAASIFVKGQTCANCGYDSTKAAQSETHA